MLRTASSGLDPFDALGDAHRRQILQLLRDGERSVGDLAGEMPISRPAVSRHLRLLREAGLVKERAVGTRRLYALHEQGVEAARQYLESVWGEAAMRYRLVASNTRPKDGPRPRRRAQDR
jgi:DNA-binding transcriptional ArsR family regulator